MRSKQKSNPLVVVLIAHLVFAQFALDAHNCVNFSCVFHAPHEAIGNNSSGTSPVPHSDCEFCKTAQTHLSTAAVQISSLMGIPGSLHPLLAGTDAPFALFVFSHATRGPPPLNL
jgi:Fe-S-cluster-containing hydrogenase component 2